MRLGGRENSYKRLKKSKKIATIFSKTVGVHFIKTIDSEIDRIFLSANVFLFSGQNLYIQLASKNTLNSAYKLNALSIILIPASNCFNEL